MQSSWHPQRYLVRMSRAFSSNRTIREYDILFLRQQGPKFPKWHQSAPLRVSESVRLSFGATIPVSELIGKSFLDTVLDDKGNRVLLQEPSLATYIINSRRTATPIYPHDASTIVSLLDLHPSRPSEDDPVDARPFEIFEAGTGMGSLTIHLARAIHAANAPLEKSLRHALCEASLQPASTDESIQPLLKLDEAEALRLYRSSRRAIIHTLDNRAEHSRQAYKLVRNFRRAQYLCSIDFHVGSVTGFLSSRLRSSNGEPFLSRAILDIPAVVQHADAVIDALLPNGLFVVFVPSISQIAEFQKWIADSSQPVRFEKVLELPVSTTADGIHDYGGGRPWDVKLVKLRQDTGGKAPSVQVMRPKVGDRVVGGGFIALLRKWPVERRSEALCTDRADVIKEQAGTVDEEGEVGA